MSQPIQQNPDRYLCPICNQGFSTDTGARIEERNPFVYGGFKCSPLCCSLTCLSVWAMRKEAERGGSASA